MEKRLLIWESDSGEKDQTFWEGHFDRVLIEFTMSVNGKGRIDGSLASKSLFSLSLTTTPPLPLAEAGNGASILLSTMLGVATAQKNKSAPSSSSRSKMKMKKKGNQLVQETIPLNDIRRTYPHLVQTMLNRGQVDDCESKLSSICVTDSSFLLIINAAEKENPFGPIYQEIHGIQAASRCINAYFSAIPDSVFNISESKFYKRSIGSEIHCTFSFSGSIIHRIVIEDLEQMHDISNAIMGLQTLAQVAIDREYLPTNEGIITEDSPEVDDDASNDPQCNQDRKEDECDDTPEAPSDTPSTASSHEDSESFQSKNRTMSDSSLSPSQPTEIGMKRRYSIDQQELVVPTGKKRLSVGEVDFFVDKDDDFASCDQLVIATSKTKFKIGERMLSARSFSTGGKIVFTLNTDKRVQKLEVTYSSRQATQSSKYIDESMIDR